MVTDGAAGSEVVFQPGVRGPGHLAQHQISQLQANSGPQSSVIQSVETICAKT